MTDRHFSEVLADAFSAWLYGTALEFERSAYEAALVRAFAESAGRSDDRTDRLMACLASLDNLTNSIHE